MNVRLREHERNLKTDKLSHLSAHCNACGCFPLFKETSVLFSNRVQRTREIVEAAHISKSGVSCISCPSVALSSREVDYLDIT